ncbi:MAG: hypothetical protein AMJ90_05625 [candidate division Zixibacteria bacterium SM23_73_2]|nr:MAG: hypothetical protein AMJ90_05625 [candidate division Zixibacteria bacterium SM23_73_2]
MGIFQSKDIKKIASCLDAVEVKKQKDHSRLKIENKKDKRQIILELYPETALGKTKGPLVVVYTPDCHLQLHNCSGYVVSDELGEVTFIGETKDKISGLVVERQAACAFYANVKRELISGDFTQLGIEVMLSGVALSLAEEIIEKKR